MAKNPFIRRLPKMTGKSTGGHKSAGILDDHAVRKNIATRQGNITGVPTNEKDIVNKEYVDNIATRGEVDLFLTENASDIATYFDLEANVITAAKENIVQSITGSSTTLIASFATILNEAEIDRITLLESGVYGLHLHAEGQVGILTFYCEFYHRTALGVETLLGTTHDSGELTTSEAQYNVHATIEGDTAFVAGDRIVIKVYGRNNLAAAKNITIYMEGDTASRAGVPGFISLGAAGVSNHSGLTELDYASAAHTGFEPAKGADDNFVTDAEKVVIGNTSGTNTGDVANTVTSTNNIGNDQIVTGDGGTRAVHHSGVLSDAAGNISAPANVTAGTTSGTFIGDGSTLTNTGAVMIGETFGPNAAGAVGNDHIIACKFTARGTKITKLGMKLYSGTVGNKMMMAIYSDNAGYPQTKLGVTGEHTLVAGDLDQDILIALGATLTLTPGTRYWISWNVDSNPLYPFETSAGPRATLGYYKALVYDGTMPNTFPAAGTTYSGRCVFGVN